VTAGPSSTADPPLQREDLGHVARQFTETVEAAAARHPTTDPWRPGAAVADANPALEDALAAAGWDDLAADRCLLPLAAPAAVALGRASAPLSIVDRLLGGALQVDGLARYAVEGGRLARPAAGGIEIGEARTRLPVPYTDALGVARVDPPEAPGGGPQPISGDRAEARMDAWIAASAGYIAGMTAEALRLAVGHARSRVAFGRPLGALEPVQQMLADAAVLSDGLSLASAEAVSADALAYAGDAAVRAVSICQQVTGALGFTLEYPLQRAYRRARACRAWNDAALRAWEGE